jgi:hypothetical protein
VKKPQEKVPLVLTKAERKLFLEDLLSTEDACASVIRATPSRQPVQFALDEWKYLDDYIAAEARDTRDRWLKKELARLQARIRRLLEGDKPPTALKIYRGGDEQVSEDAVNLPRKDKSNDEN